MEDDLKVDLSFVSTWHPRYDEIENDETEYKALVALTNKDITEQKTLTEQTFIRILDWKSPRIKGIVRLNEFGVYENGIRDAYGAEEDRKLEALLQLYGIGAPVASTILHFMYPDAFPIIDVRTVETLCCAGRIKHHSTDASRYATFRAEMLEILKEVPPFTLREIDRALFAYHKIHLSQNKRCRDTKNGPGRPKVPRTRGNGMTIRDKVLSVFENRTGEMFRREEIIDLVVGAYPGTFRGSVIPSDYCYNSINKDSTSFKLHLFESLGAGGFKCLGLNSTYSGPVYWKSEQVGQWEEGKVRLWKDPRK
ncbi:MAG: hypothetical protein JW884_07820 [Deltaproteobacteria bacterium]|nr:hypothetical protein [Deltaproteobacteria bacterium]